MDVKSCMLSDAAQLTVKIAGAEAAGLYDLRMGKTANIRKTDRDLAVRILSDKGTLNSTNSYQIFVLILTSLKA